MSEVVNEEVLVRLERIERENRILKRCLILGMMALVALTVMAQAPSRPRTLEAERLVIRYPNGKEGIVLSTGQNTLKEDFAQADFHMPNGRRGAWITAGSNGGSVAVVSPKLEFQMIMSSGSTFSGGDLSKATGERASLILLRTQNGQAAKQMFNLSGDADEAALYMYSDNEAQLRLTNGPQGAAVQLWDSPKTLRAVLGRTNLETVRSGSVENLPLSSLVLFDKEGKVLWKAP